MDTTPLERDLLQHRDFLLRLAAGLVGTNDAEDLVQDVWTKALAHPGGDPGAARGWLARVARNLAVNRFRARSRRERREREHGPAESDSASVSATSERFELTQRVAAAVRTLEEPYRAVILLRFFEGLDHATMAARLGAPIATVRTRQQRALAKLRERLDRELGGRQAWGLALAAWSAPQGLAAPVAGSAVALVAASAVVVGLAGGAWWLVRGQGASSSAAGAVAAATEAAATVVATTESAATEAAVDGATPSGAPVETGARRESPASLRAPARVALEQEQRAAPGDDAVLRGRVLRPDGNPAAGAALEVYGLEDGLPRETATATMRCDDEGRFELRLEHGGALVAIALVEGLRPGHAMLQARVGQALEVPDLVLEDGERLAGRVLRLGTPMPLARVGIRSEERGRTLRRAQGPEIAWIAGRPEWTGAGFEADALGRFDRSGFAARDYLLEVAGSLDMGTLPMRYESVRVRASSTELALEFQASLVTLVRAPGSGAAEGWLHVRSAGVELNGLWLSASEESDERIKTFVAPPATALELSIELTGQAPIPLDVVTPGPGQELRCTIAYGAPAPLATLELEWTPPEEEMKGLRVTFVTPEGQQRLERRFRVGEIEGGLVRIEGVPPGRYRVHIAPGEYLGDVFPALPAELELELGPGETVRERFAFEPAGLVRLDVRAASGERCRARFRMLDSAGAVVRVTFVTRGVGNSLFEDSGLTPWSVHESKALAAGDYELVLWDDDLAEQRVPVRVVAGETTDVAVTLQPK